MNLHMWLWNKMPKPIQMFLVWGFTGVVLAVIFHCGMKHIVVPILKYYLGLENR